MNRIHDAVVVIADRLFAAEAEHGTSLALVVQHRGAVVFERYGRQPDTAFGPGGQVEQSTTLTSWSMAKSITHAAVGVAIGDGLLELQAPADVAEWKGTDREAITLLQLLEMRSGLEFVEDYVDDSVSNCIEMLFGSGADDVAGYAASLPLLHPPGTFWNYSSGTSNIVSRLLGQALERVGQSIEPFLHTRLFAPLGMTSAQPKFDASGTFIGSSFVYATGRDFAKFGQLYLDGGMVADQRVLPQGWTAGASVPVSFDTEGNFGYGRHWWMWPEFGGSLACHGYEGQYILVVPDRDLVVVHLGKSPADKRASLRTEIASIVGAFEP